MTKTRNSFNALAMKSTDIANKFCIDHVELMNTLHDIRESLPASMHHDIELRTRENTDNSYYLVSCDVFTELSAA